MNGDIGKLPPGAGYPSTPESLAAVAGVGPGIDYTVMNGGPAPTELMLDTGVASLEPIPQLAMGMGGAVGYVEMTPLADVSSPPNQMPDITPNIPIDQLKQMLSSQLEYYFSRENLANDTYLLSQMDNDQYVPIWTVANFNQVKKLTKDIKLITEVLRESPNVQVDEEGQKVRPNHKRCIVILREIPDSTPLEDVKNLFSGEGCPRFISCEFAHNSSWYVTFESDEDAQKAYRFLREEVREFQGKPIMARIKAKPMNRLPMAAVTSVGGMKNGYRTPPPPPVYGDPSSYQPGQQRFLYTNGTTMPQTTMPPYPNQVVYHQPFYPAGMIPWGPASPAYFDMNSVFTMNGIASHSSFKPHNTRFNQRNSTYSRNKQRNGSDRGGGGGGGGGGLMDSGGNMVPMARTSHPPLSGGPVPLGVAAPTLPNILPSAKPISSSYSAGTKFQSSHAPSIGGESQYTSSHVNKGSQDTLRNKKNISSNASSFSLKENEVQSQDPSIQFPRHRTHRRTKDPETLSKTNSGGGGGGGGLGPGNTSGGAGSNALPSSVSKEASSGSSSGPGGGGAGSGGAGGGGAQHNRGVQFDLEASAFPPLPGLADASKPPHNSNDSPAAPEQSQQNRLSDVVKGTAKLKSTNKDKELSSASSTTAQAPSSTTTTTGPYHHQQHQQHHQQQQYHHQPAPQPHHHHHHHHHHHQQQQQQHHHQHHHQTIVSSSSGASNVTRSTSPGNHHHHQQQQQPPPQQQHPRTSSSSSDAPAANSNTPAPTTAGVAPAAAAAAGGDSDVALSTVTLTPPSSPDKTTRGRAMPK